MPRTPQFGSIEQLPSGHWRARYTGPDGNRHKAPTTFHAKADALIWLRGEEKLIAFNEWAPPESRHARTESPTLEEWLEQWLILLEDSGRSPSTLQMYRKTLDSRILKTTGKSAKLRGMKLAYIRRQDILEWWDAVTNEFGPQPHNYNTFTRLHTALAAAVGRELIPANPAANIKAISRPAPHRKELPDAAGLQRIIDEMPDNTRLVSILTLFHGLRIGEALGLRRKDVVDRGESVVVRVRGTVWRKEGEGAVYKPTPKTDAANREVPIFAKFHGAVREHLHRFTGTSEDAFLFTTGTGRLIMDTSFRTIQLRAKNRARVKERITPHYGRVWLITMLAEEGMSPAAIGRILGQRDLRTITEVYMRASEGKTRELVDRVGRALEN